MTDSKCEFIMFFGKSEYEKVKWETGYAHRLEFDENFKQYAQLKRWCEENLSDKVVFWETDEPWISKDTLYFFDEGDAVACKLRWV